MRRAVAAVLLLVVAVSVPVFGGTSPVSAAGETKRSGYWMLGSDGGVFAFGDARELGDQSSVLRVNPSFRGSPVKRHESVDLEPSPSGDGYWVLSNAGSIDAYGDARGRVSIDEGALTLNAGEQATSLSVTPSGNGLWVFTSQGRTITYGDARHLGDMSGTPLNGPVLDAVPTPLGNGYYMVGSDGGIFAFGDAAFHGSMGGKRLNAPVQSLVPDGDGTGYWLVASDGGIFAFNAPFRGSMGGQRLNKPVTGMVRFGDGYLMVGEDGGIFSFSDQPFFGSLGDRPPVRPIVSVAAFGATSLKAATSPSTSQPSATTSPEATTTTGGAAPPSTTTSTAPPPTTTTAPPTTTTTRPPGTDPSTGVPTYEYNCLGESETVRVWIYDRSVNAETWAVDNPCTNDWVVVGFSDGSDSAGSGRMLNVAPQMSFREPAAGWMTDRPGTEYVDVSGEPYTTCDVGSELWEIGPDTAGELELLAVCPTRGDERDLHYDGPLCFGRIPDHIGSARDDRWGNEDDDVNGDGYVTIYGGDGSDYWSSRDIDSGTFIDTWFCGGPGDDSASGWLEAIDGGDGNDRFSPSACGTSWRHPTIVNVEVVYPYDECPEGTP
jgi:hypothetical protein